MCYAEVCLDQIQGCSSAAEGGNGMTTPRNRWAHATDTHGRRAKEILIGIIRSLGRPLPGGVTEDLVRGLRLHDALDLAQQTLDGGIPGGDALASVLHAACTAPQPKK